MGEGQTHASNKFQVSSKAVEHSKGCEAECICVGQRQWAGLVPFHHAHTGTRHARPASHCTAAGHAGLRRPRAPVPRPADQGLRRVVVRRAAAGADARGGHRRHQAARGSGGGLPGQLHGRGGLCGGWAAARVDGPAPRLPATAVRPPGQLPRRRRCGAPCLHNGKRTPATMWAWPGAWAAQHGMRHLACQYRSRPQRPVILANVGQLPSSVRAAGPLPGGAGARRARCVPQLRASAAAAGHNARTAEAAAATVIDTELCQTVQRVGGGHYAGVLRPAGHRLSHACGGWVGRRRGGLKRAYALSMSELAYA